ncbi:MAG: biotin/lipoyl-containing protein [Gemmatimonadota bacterium]
MNYQVVIGEAAFEVEIDEESVRVDGEIVEVDWLAAPPGANALLSLDGRAHSVGGRRQSDGFWALSVNGESFRAEVLDDRTLLARQVSGASGRATGPRPVRAPMPGLVIRVEVSVGQAVRRGEGVAIVEAMKMENELKAEADGVVDRVLVQAGETVEKDQVMIEWKTPEVP